MEVILALALKGKGDEFFYIPACLGCVWLMVEEVNASHLKIVVIPGQRLECSGQQHLQLTGSSPWFTASTAIPTTWHSWLSPAAQGCGTHF